MTERGDELARVLLYYGLIPDTNSASYKIVCPFHGDVNPSLLANINDGGFYCFGCGLAGDSLKFVQLYERQQGNALNDLQALERHNEIIHSDIVGEIVVNARRTRSKGFSRQLYDMSYDYYHGLKTVPWRASQELEIDIAREYMLRRGFEPKTLELCGAKLTYNKAYPLIFPMMDNGKFRGWVCRTMDARIEQKRKYLYNEGFRRALTLVGDYGARAFGASELAHYVIVVEGYLDRLKLVQFGVKNAVAILGWKMSEQQIKKLKSAGIERVISALDNDDAGRKGTRWLKQNFDMTRFKYLKGYKDPGDFDEESFARMMTRTMIEFENNQKKEGK